MIRSNTASNKTNTKSINKTNIINQASKTKYFISFATITILIVACSIPILYFDNTVAVVSLLQTINLVPRKLQSINSGKTHADVGCEGTIILMRHCEKQSLVTDNQFTHDHCNYIGLLRAEYLTALFGNGSDYRWPIPSYLYALSPERKNHNISRQLETLEPLSNTLNLPINSKYRKKDMSKLSSTLLQSFKNGGMCGKLTVICWNHGDIPTFAKELGCTPYNGCPMEYNSVGYDEVWQIQYSYNTLSKKKDAKWEVFGTVFDFGFDPLAFSKTMGKYKHVA